MLTNIVSENKEITVEAKRDLIIAMITLKYTQSNSVCYAYDGQVIGCGAGQQSRIHCTRLAGSKADTWYLRQHPSVLNLRFKEEVARPDIDNAIDQFLRDNVTEIEKEKLEQYFYRGTRAIDNRREKAMAFNLKKGVSLASDAFFPFL